MRKGNTLIESLLFLLLFSLCLMSFTRFVDVSLEIEIPMVSNTISMNESCDEKCILNQVSP